jgi:branched-chain amino acid transport system ATP-binding protein
MLQTQGLTKRFDGLTAVQDVSIEVQKGEIKGIIGSNGAGKTTLFNLLSGTLKPSEGQIFFKSDDITYLPSYKRARLGISRCYQIDNTFKSKSVYENIQLAVGISDYNNYNFTSNINNINGMREKVEQILKKVGLYEEKNNVAGELSHGNKRSLEIGLALATDPELILFDEPTAGMTRAEIENVKDFIEEIAEKRTIIIVEHNIEYMMDIVHNIIVLNQGEVIAEGSPEEISSNTHVQKSYLGENYA